MKLLKQVISKYLGYLPLYVLITIFTYGCANKNVLDENGNQLYYDIENGYITVGEYIYQYNVAGDTVVF